MIFVSFALCSLSFSLSLIQEFLLAIAAAASAAAARTKIVSVLVTDKLLQVRTVF